MGEPERHTKMPSSLPRSLAVAAATCVALSEAVAVPPATPLEPKAFEWALPYGTAKAKVIDEAAVKPPAALHTLSELWAKKNSSVAFNLEPEESWGNGLTKNKSSTIQFQPVS